MLSSAVPSKISVPFAANGGKNSIPVTSQTSTNPGGASFNDGFPVATRTPVAAGGVPPSGQDMNGILNAITAIQQWQSAGGLFKYDSTFATAVGGYPKGATLISSDGVREWRSIVDGNMTDPDSGSASGWILIAGNTAVSKSPNGYLTFPNGLIIQWGSAVSVSGSSGTTVTYPIPFPTSLSSLVANTFGATSTTNYPIIATGSITTSAFNFFASISPASSGSNISGQNVFWNAIGY